MLRCYIHALCAYPFSDFFAAVAVMSPVFGKEGNDGRLFN